MTNLDSESADTHWACARKKAYPSESIAKLSVASISKASPGADVRAYLCRRCGLWHVGATPASERRVVSFSDDADASPRHRDRPPRRRSYGDSSVRRRSVSPRARRDIDDDE